MKTLLKIQSIVVILSLLSQILFGFKAEASIWEERRVKRQGIPKPEIQLANLPTGISFPQIIPGSLKTISDFPPTPSRFQMDLAQLYRVLPSRLGGIRKIYLPADPKGPPRVVFHIQDVHRNSEAQKNISQAIQALIKTGKVGLIALEAGFKRLDLRGIDEFGDQESFQKAADYLLENKKLTGALHALLYSGPSRPQAIGVDDETIYRKNVLACRNSAELKAQALQKIESLKISLASEKEKIFPPELKILDSLVRNHRERKISFGEFVSTLAQRTAPSMRDFPQINKYLEAFKLERSIEFSRAEAERKFVLAELLEGLNGAELNQLLQLSSEYSAGFIPSQEFYRFIERLCGSKKISLDKFPVFKKYVHYLLLAGEIDSAVLFEEAKRLEEEAFSKLTHDEREKELIEEDRFLNLLSGLTEFSHSSRDWAAYQKMKAKVENGRPSYPSSFVHPGKGQSEDWMGGGFFSRIPFNLFESFEEFYRSAAERDSKMAENLTKTWNLRGGQITVLITGGFHSEGMRSHLNSKGFTVLEFVPAMQKVETDSGSQYLSVFTQEKTPLEKLAQKDRLFLAEPVWDEAVQLRLSATAFLRHVFLRIPLLSSRVKANLLARFERLTGRKLKYVTVKGGDVSLLFEEKDVLVKGHLGPGGEIISVEEKTASPSLRERLLSPFLELPRTIRFLSNEVAINKFLLGHGAQTPEAIVKRLIGVAWIIGGSYVGFASGLCVGIMIFSLILSSSAVLAICAFVAAPLLGELIGHLGAHLAFNVLFPESPLVLSKDEGMFWMDLGVVGHKMKEMRSLPIQEGRPGAGLRREDFSSRYDEFLGRPENFWEATGQWKGSVRIDTSIWNQGRLEHQGALEVLANAIDGTIERLGGEPIGRFGNGFRSILAVLELFPKKGSRVSVRTKTKTGAARELRFRYRTRQLEGQMAGVHEVAWRPLEGKVPQGTRVDVQLDDFPSRAAYLEKLEREISRGFSGSPHVRIRVKRPGGKEYILNPLNGQGPHKNPFSGMKRLSAGQKIKNYAYPKEEILIEIRRDGFSITDSGTGISDQILMENFLVPRSPTDKVQTGEAFEMLARPRSNKSVSEKKVCHLRVTKGGRTILTEWADPVGRNFPEAFELALPPKAWVAESWDRFNLEARESDEASNEVRRMVRFILENENATTEEKAQYFNAFAQILLRLREMTSFNLLESAVKEIYPWVGKMKEEGFVILPNYKGFYSLKKNGKRWLYLDPNFVPFFSPDEIPRAEQIQKFGDKPDQRFEFVRRGKAFYLVDFTDPRQISFEFDNVVYYSRRHFDPHKGVPAPPEHWQQGGWTSYEDMGREVPKSFEPLPPDEEAPREVDLARDHPFLNDLEEKLRVQILDFIRYSLGFIYPEWLTRLGQFVAILSKGISGNWLPDLVSAVNRRRASGQLAKRISHPKEFDEFSTVLDIHEFHGRRFASGWLRDRNEKGLVVVDMDNGQVVGRNVYDKFFLKKDEEIVYLRNEEDDDGAHFFIIIADVSGRVLRKVALEEDVYSPQVAFNEENFWVLESDRLLQYSYQMDLISTISFPSDFESSGFELIEDKPVVVGICEHRLAICVFDGTKPDVYFLDNRKRENKTDLLDQNVQLIQQSQDGLFVVDTLPSVYRFVDGEVAMVTINGMNEIYGMVSDDTFHYFLAKTSLGSSEFGIFKAKIGDGKLTENERGDPLFQYEGVPLPLEGYSISEPHYWGGIFQNNTLVYARERLYFYATNLRTGTEELVQYDLSIDEELEAAGESLEDESSVRVIRPEEVAEIGEEYGAVAEYIQIGDTIYFVTREGAKSIWELVLLKEGKITRVPIPVGGKYFEVQVFDHKGVPYLSVISGPTDDQLTRVRIYPIEGAKVGKAVYQLDGSWGDVIIDGSNDGFLIQTTAWAGLKESIIYFDLQSGTAKKLTPPEGLSVFIPCRDSENHSYLLATEEKGSASEAAQTLIPFDGQLAGFNRWYWFSDIYTWSPMSYGSAQIIREGEFLYGRNPNDNTLFRFTGDGVIPIRVEGVEVILHAVLFQGEWYVMGKEKKDDDGILLWRGVLEKKESGALFIKTVPIEIAGYKNPGNPRVIEDELYFTAEKGGSLLLVRWKPPNEMDPVIQPSPPISEPQPAFDLGEMESPGSFEMIFVNGVLYCKWEIGEKIKLFKNEGGNWVPLVPLEDYELDLGPMVALGRDILLVAKKDGKRFQLRYETRTGRLVPNQFPEPYANLDPSTIIVVVGGVVFFRLIEGAEAFIIGWDGEKWIPDILDDLPDFVIYELIRRGDRLGVLGADEEGGKFYEFDIDGKIVGDTSFEAFETSDSSEVSDRVWLAFGQKEKSELEEILLGQNGKAEFVPFPQMKDVRQGKARGDGVFVVQGEDADSNQGIFIGKILKPNGKKAYVSFLDQVESPGFSEPFLKGIFGNDVYFLAKNVETGRTHLMKLPLGPLGPPLGSSEPKVMMAEPKPPEPEETEGPPSVNLEVIHNFGKVEPLSPPVEFRGKPTILGKSGETVGLLVGEDFEPFLEQIGQIVPQELIPFNGSLFFMANDFPVRIDESGVMVRQEREFRDAGIEKVLDMVEFDGVLFLFVKTEAGFLVISSQDGINFSQNPLRNFQKVEFGIARMSKVGNKLVFSSGDVEEGGDFKVGVYDSIHSEPCVGLIIADRFLFGFGTPIFEHGGDLYFLQGDHDGVGNLFKFDGIKIEKVKKFGNFLAEFGDIDSDGERIFVLDQEYGLLEKKGLCDPDSNREGEDSKDLGDELESQGYVDISKFVIRNGALHILAKEESTGDWVWGKVSRLPTAPDVATPSKSTLQTVHSFADNVLPISEPVDYGGSVAVLGEYSEGGHESTHGVLIGDKFFKLPKKGARIKSDLLIPFKGRLFFVVDGVPTSVDASGHFSMFDRFMKHARDGGLDFDNMVVFGDALVFGLKGLRGYRVCCTYDGVTVDRQLFPLKNFSAISGDVSTMVKVGDQLVFQGSTQIDSMLKQLHGRSSRQVLTIGVYETPESEPKAGISLDALEFYADSPGNVFAHKGQIYILRSYKPDGLKVLYRFVDDTLEVVAHEIKFEGKVISDGDQTYLFDQDGLIFDFETFVKTGSIGEAEIVGSQKLPGPFDSFSGVENSKAFEVLEEEVLRDGVLYVKGRRWGATGWEWLKLVTGKTADLQAKSPVVNPYQIGNIDVDEAGEPLRHFLRRYAGFFRANPKFRRQILGRLFYERELGVEWDDEVFKILTLFPERMLGFISRPLIELLKPFVVNRNMNDLRQFFEVAGGGAPKLADRTETTQFFERWLKLYQSLAKRRNGLKDLFDLVTPQTLLILGQRNPIQDEQIEDTFLLLAFRYLRGEVDDFFEEKDDPIPAPPPSQIVKGGELKTPVPLAAVGLAYEDGKRSEKEISQGMKPSSIQDVKSVAEFEKRMGGYEGRDLSHPQKEMRSTIWGQDHSDHVGSRELFQNGRDAGRGKPVKIESFRRKGTREWVRRFTDIGSGMDLSRILGPLLVIEVSDKLKGAFTGIFGQGFFTLFTDYDRVRVKTGTGNKTFYLTLEKAKNLDPAVYGGLDPDLPVLVQLVETREKFQGTVVEWVSDFDPADPPFLESLFFAQDVARYVGAVSEAETPTDLNGRRINEKMDAVETVEAKFNVPDRTGSGEKIVTAQVRVSLCPTSVTKRVTQDELFVLPLQPWMFELVPPKLRSFLWMRGINIEVPEFMEPTRTRTGFIHEDRYKRPIQEAIFLASVKLAVKIYFVRNVLPPGLSEDFFSDKSITSEHDPDSIREYFVEVDGRAEARHVQIVEPSVLEDSRKINSDDPEQIPQIKFEDYVPVEGDSEALMAQKNRRLSELLSVVAVNLDGEKKNLWEIRRGLKKLSEGRASEAELRSFLRDVGRKTGARFAGRLHQAHWGNEMNRQQKEEGEFIVPEDMIRRSPALSRYRRFFERMLSVLPNAKLKGGRIGFSYRSFGESASYDKRGNKINIRLDSEFSNLKVLDEVLRSGDHHAAFRYFIEALETVLHELTHETDPVGKASHEAADIEKDVEGEAPYFAGELEELPNIGGFGYRLLQLSGEFQSALGKGTWREIAQDIQREFPDGAPDLEQIRGRVIKGFEDQKFFSPGSWAGGWLFLENGLRGLMGFELKDRLSSREARWRFPVYGVLEGLIAVGIVLVSPNLATAISLWAALNIFLHIVGGIFTYRVNGEWRVVSLSKTLRSPPNQRARAVIGFFALSLIPNLIAILTGSLAIVLAFKGLWSLAILVSILSHPLLNFAVSVTVPLLQRMKEKRNAPERMERAAVWIESRLAQSPLEYLGLEYADGPINLNEISSRDRRLLIGTIRNRSSDRRKAGRGDRTPIPIEKVQDAMRPLLFGGEVRPLLQRIGNRDLVLPASEETMDPIRQILDELASKEAPNRIYLVGDLESPPMQAWASALPTDFRHRIVWIPSEAVISQGQRLFIQLKGFEMSLLGRPKEERDNMVIIFPRDTVFDSAGLNPNSPSILHEMKILMVDYLLNSVPITFHGIVNLSRISRLISRQA